MRQVRKIRIINKDGVSRDIMGCPSISGTHGASINGTNRSIRIDIPEVTGYTHPYKDRLDAGHVPTLPYIASIDGVRADQYGCLYILGGHTSQIDHKDHGINICDMSQDNRYPQIFRSIYDMLTILRRWIDGHKDSLLLYGDLAEKQWSEMLSEDYNDYYQKAGSDVPDYPLYKDPDTGDLISDRRTRDAISSFSEPIGLLNEYQSVVAMWNYVASQPEHVSTARIHPGDNAGVYIGAAINIPTTNIPDNTTGYLRVLIKISVSMSGQSSVSEKNKAYMWMRSPDAYSKLVPAAPGVRISGPVVPGSSVIGTNPQSILDAEGRISDIVPETSLDTYMNVYIPISSNMSTVYTVQTLLEAIPFCLCGTENSYYDSKTGVHFVQQDLNTWTIRLSVHTGIVSSISTGSGESTPSKDMTELVNDSIVKTTQYAQVCDDPYVEEDEDDSTGNE